MENPSQSRSGRGLWNNPRPAQYSKETQDMLKLMMQESRLTTLQRKQINESLKNGAALPMNTEPTVLASARQPKTSKTVKRHLIGKPQKRSAESCRSGNNYVREKFHPGPTRDLEKEKMRLQNILATGQEKPMSASPPNGTACNKCNMSDERDRYQEVLEEIEERRQFLADMASLGQEKKYTNIINTEISQKIRELELLDKIHSKNDALTPERNKASAEQTHKKVDLKETGQMETGNQVQET